MKKLFSVLFVSVLAFGMIAIAFAGQNPSQSYTAVNTSGFAAPQKLDANGSLVANTGGTSSTLNVTASTVVKTGVGRIVRFIVTTAGSAGAIYDSITSGTAANLIAVMPATVGIYTLDFPVTTGVLVIPGASQVVSVSTL